MSVRKFWKAFPAFTQAPFPQTTMGSYCHSTRKCPLGGRSCGPSSRHPFPSRLCKVPILAWAVAGERPRYFEPRFASKGSSPASNRQILCKANRSVSCEESSPSGIRH